MIIGTASCSNLPVKAADMQAATLPGRQLYQVAFKHLLSYLIESLVGIIPEWVLDKRQSFLCFIPFVKSVRLYVSGICGSLCYLWLGFNNT
jgi:hypothetical protein